MLERGVCLLKHHPKIDILNECIADLPVKRYDNFFNFKSEEAKRKVIDVLKLEINQFHVILKELSELIDDSPSMIGNETHRFYTIFSKFVNSNTSFELKMNYSDRDKILEWMTKEKQEEIVDMRNRFDKLEQNRNDLINGFVWSSVLSKEENLMKNKRDKFKLKILDKTLQELK